MNCTTAQASPAAGTYFLYAQALEGQDVQRILKGTASAQQLTLTFWVKSNVTGTYVVELSDVTNTRQVSASYTVSASATWEQKTVTFSADTTGVIANDANAGLQLSFWLTAGSTYSSGTLATTWHTSTTTNRATGQTNLAAATSNYWQVTGVQLEVGTVSTPFEFLSYGDELRRCQRYFQKLGGITGARFGIGSAFSTTQIDVLVPLVCQMRAVPTACGDTGSASDYAIQGSNGSGITCTSVSYSSSASSTTVINVTCVVASGMTGGQGLPLYARTNNAYLLPSAEI